MRTLANKSLNLWQEFGTLGRWVQFLCCISNSLCMSCAISSKGLWDCQLHCLNFHRDTTQAKLFSLWQWHDAEVKKRDGSIWWPALHTVVRDTLTASSNRQILFRWTFTFTDEVRNYVWEFCWVSCIEKAEPIYKKATCRAIAQCISITVGLGGLDVRSTDEHPNAALTVATVFSIVLKTAFLEAILALLAGQHPKSALCHVMFRWATSSPPIKDIIVLQFDVSSVRLRIWPNLCSWDHTTLCVISFESESSSLAALWDLYCNSAKIRDERNNIVFQSNEHISQSVHRRHGDIGITVGHSSQSPSK